MDQKKLDKHLLLITTEILQSTKYPEEAKVVAVTRILGVHPDVFRQMLLQELTRRGTIKGDA